MVSEQIDICEENFIMCMVLLKTWKRVGIAEPQLVADLEKIENFLMLFWSSFSLQEEKIKQLEEKNISINNFMGTH